MDRIKKLSVVVVITGASVAQAAPSPAQKCAAAKLKATSSLATAVIACKSKAVLAGSSVDDLCLSKAESKFGGAFAKAESKGGCATSGDADPVLGIVDAYADSLGAALDPSTAPVPDKSFAADVQPILTLNCALGGCHQGETPAGNMNLSAGNAYANIVNVASKQIPERKRVLPEDAANSYLYQKITGAEGILGVPMPKGNFPLSSNKIDTIEAWINQGALDN